MLKAHRVAYELWWGPIPVEKQLDHLCRRRSCCNPAHLEAVSPRENVLRGIGPAAQHYRQTRCIRGHEFDLLNTYIYGNGHRYCRTCRRAATARRKQRKKTAPEQVIVI